MERIYLDNAATSWPKPEAVYRAIDQYQREQGAPAGRSTYREAIEAAAAVRATRRRVAELVGIDDPEHVVFGYNGTDVLNLAIHGLLRPGDHVVTTAAEHNSVLRPLRTLEGRGLITVTRVGCNAAGQVAVDDVRQALQPGTRLLAVTHASNVTGALQPIADLGALAWRQGTRVLIDAAQTLGHVPMRMSELPIDLLAAPGHKGLLGPLGTGVLAIRAGLEAELTSVRQGGTGSQSEEDRQPELLPDKYESGNLNVPGVLGLGAGVEYLLAESLERVRAHERARTDQLCDGLDTIIGVRRFGPPASDQRVGVVSCQVVGYDPQELAAALDAVAGVQVRAGLHCAPRIHHALGTAAGGGTLRFSVGPFTSADDVATALAALAELASTR